MAVAYLTSMRLRCVFLDFFLCFKNGFSGDWRWVFRVLAGGESFGITQWIDVNIVTLYTYRRHSIVQIAIRTQF
jgi:hypothetical protein